MVHVVAYLLILASAASAGQLAEQCSRLKEDRSDQDRKTVKPLIDDRRSMIDDRKSRIKDRRSKTNPCRADGADGGEKQLEEGHLHRVEADGPQAGHHQELKGRPIDIRVPEHIRVHEHIRMPEHIRVPEHMRPSSI